MRVLCLHGVGSSAKIFKGQISSIIRAADASYEFVFVNGPFEASRGPGLSEAVPPPFYSHCTGYTPTEMQEAATHISLHIATHGPFDGILGLSQGATTALAYMYQDRLDRSNGTNLNGRVGSGGSNTPFRFGVLFSAMLPMSSDMLCHATLLRDLWRVTNCGMAKSAAMDTLVECTAKAVAAAKQFGGIGPEFEIDLVPKSQSFGTDGTAAPSMDNIPRMIHPDLNLERLSIPTVHAIGKKDVKGLIEMAETAVKLCEPDMVRVVRHPGGHQVPKLEIDARQVVVAMDWAAGQGRKARLDLGTNVKL